MRPAVTRRSVTEALGPRCSPAPWPGIVSPPEGLYHPSVNHSPKECLPTCNPPGRGPWPLFHPPCSLQSCSRPPCCHSPPSMWPCRPWIPLGSPHFAPPTPALQGTLGAEGRLLAPCHPYLLPQPAPIQAVLVTEACMSSKYQPAPGRPLQSRGSRAPPCALCGTQRGAL